MQQKKDLKGRRANVLHVQATNRLSGVEVSQYMAARIEEYANGHISSAELLAEAKKRYSIHKLSSSPRG
tara:strand:- start:2774 stop:2980 length:207 start_codon:yes stop_codon:yes gene_type:complete